MNPSNAKARARALLQELSLDEKMAQVGCIFPFNGGEHDFEAISRQTRSFDFNPTSSG